MSRQKKIKKTGLSRLLEIAGERRNMLAVSGFLSVFSTLLMFVPFISTYFIVEEILKNATDASLINTSIIQSWGIWALVSLVAALVTQYGSIIASHIAAFRILYGLRIRATEHLAKLSMGYHTQTASGKIKKNLELSVEKIEVFIAHQLQDLIGAVAFILIMLTAMFFLDWRLALSCTFPVLFSFVCQFSAFFGKKAKGIIKEYHNSLEQMNAAGVEYVRGMPAVKVFGLTVSSFLGFQKSIEGYRDCGVKIGKVYKHSYTAFLTIISSILSFVLPVGVFILNGQPENQAFALILMLFLAVSPGMSVPILKLLNIGGNMQMISEGVERVDEIFAQKPMEEPNVPKAPKTSEVEYSEVSFSYDNKDSATRVDALKNVSFIAEEKKITALVGPSGSGKSTIASLIPRFWDVTSGSISIGGVDVKEIGTEKLMDTVSFVFQDVRLFFDTIEENIRMGNTEASMVDIIDAAKAACSHEFIEKLPQGYQTKIGEGGTYLSGGEAQRVAIARAILKNAPILVLDEATAFADPENENKIQEALSYLIRGKTVIIIAHRLSTIREADQILVIDEGEIVERGRHDTLIEKNGLYCRMWEAHIDADAWVLSKRGMAESL